MFFLLSLPFSSLLFYILFYKMTGSSTSDVDLAFVFGCLAPEALQEVKRELSLLGSLVAFASPLSSPLQQASQPSSTTLRMSVCRMPSSGEKSAKVN